MWTDWLRKASGVLALALLCCAGPATDARGRDRVAKLHALAMQGILDGSILEDDGGADVTLQESVGPDAQDSFELAAAVRLVPLQATVTLPAGRSVRSQIEDLTSHSPQLEDPEILQRLQVTTSTFTEDECPALRSLPIRLSELAVSWPQPPTAATDRARALSLSVRAPDYNSGVGLGRIDPRELAYRVVAEAIDGLRACARRVKPSVPRAESEHTADPDAGEGEHEVRDPVAEARSVFSQDLEYLALDEFFTGETLADGSAADLIVHESKSYPREDDLETVASLAFDPLRVTLRHATGRPLGYQIYAILSRSYPIPVPDALRQLEITTVTLTEAQCPALRQIRSELAEIPLVLPLPDPPEAGFGTRAVHIFVHPRIFGIEARGEPYDVALWGVDPALPSFVFGRRTLERIRACEASPL